MNEHAKDKLRQQYHALSDEDLKGMLAMDRSLYDEDIYGLLIEEARRRGMHQYLDALKKAAPQEESVSEPQVVEEKAIFMAIGLLVINSILLLWLLIWETLIGLGATSGATDIAFIFVDLYFAYALFKRQPWAAKWVKIRAIAGCTIWGGIDLFQGNFYGLIANLIFFGALIALLSEKANRTFARRLGYGAFILLLFTGYQNIDAMMYHRNTIAKTKELGQDSYISSEYGIVVTAPDRWKIILRKDFRNIDEYIEETDAEAVMISEDALSYCLIIPEILEGYGDEYDIEDLRTVFLKDVEANEGAVELIENEMNDRWGDESFEIRYNLWDMGYFYNYMILYAIYRDKGVQLLAWTVEPEPERIFEDIRETLDAVEIVW